MNRGLILALAACGGSTPATNPSARTVAAAIDAPPREPNHCATLDTPALATETLTTGTQHWQIAEHSLTREGSAERVVIGAIADAGDAAPPTLAALGRLRAKLDAAAPDVVVVLGGMGATQAELEATLGTIGDRATWPVVALPGDLESVPALTAAIAALRGRGDPVIDGRLARWIEVGGVTIATIPGVAAVSRLRAGPDGCIYRPEDVAHVLGELANRPGLRIAASAEAPRNGESGELALGGSETIDVALHGPTSPSPTAAKSGGRDGARVALTPGTSDAVPRLPVPQVPSAGFVTVRGGAWSWTPLRDAK